MTAASPSPVAPRAGLIKKLFLKTLIHWRGLAATAAYLLSGLAAAASAKSILLSPPSTPGPIPDGWRSVMLAALVAWAVVAFVRGLDGRMGQPANKTKSSLPAGAMVLQYWIIATVILVLALLAVDVLARLKIPNVVEPAPVLRVPTCSRPTC